MEKRGKEFRGHFSARENFSPLREGNHQSKMSIISILDLFGEKFKATVKVALIFRSEA